MCTEGRETMGIGGNADDHSQQEKRSGPLSEESEQKSLQRRGATAQLSSVRANAVRKEKRTRRRKGHCVLG